jgi:hypothetical protein
MPNDPVVEIDLPAKARTRRIEMLAALCLECIHRKLSVGSISHAHRKDMEVIRHETINRREAIKTIELLTHDLQMNLNVRRVVEYAAAVMDASSERNGDLPNVGLRGHPMTLLPWTIHM